jgi:hypothetical protein
MGVCARFWVRYEMEELEEAASVCGCTMSE